jgi:hypothetical protein
VALLSEYALTPDIFDVTSYSSEEVCDVRLQNLKEVLISEGLVRDLRDGEWFAQFSNIDRPWSKRCKELLRKLAQHNRLRQIPPMLKIKPNSDCEWCHEAVASNNSIPLSGIISSANTVNDFTKEPLVAPINQLAITPWWVDRSTSVRLSRSIDSYKQHLRLVLDCANSIMLIDPYINPTLPHYRDFLALLVEAGGRAPLPLIEIHRVCYFNSSDKRDLHSESEWKDMFSSWKESLQNAGIAVEMYIWDDFHDRYLISDLVGISVPWGFSTTQDSQSITTWTRLGRGQRDEVQREFHESSDRHGLRHRFRIPD